MNRNSGNNRSRCNSRSTVVTVVMLVIVGIVGTVDTTV